MPLNQQLTFTTKKKKNKHSNTLYINIGIRYKSIRSTYSSVTQHICKHGLHSIICVDIDPNVAHNILNVEF